jgi:hypothetical protein
MSLGLTRAAFEQRRGDLRTQERDNVPIATTRKKPDPDKFYVARVAFVGVDARVVRTGQRLRGDDPIADDGTSAEEMQAQMFAEVDAVVAAHRPPPPPRPRPLLDEDAVIAVRNVDSAPAGKKLRRDDPLVRRNREAFVDVVPTGLDRSDALVAAVTIRAAGEDGRMEVIHAGCWLHFEHRFATASPHLFSPPAPPDPRWR